MTHRKKATKAKPINIAGYVLLIDNDFIDFDSNGHYLFFYKQIDAHRYAESIGYRDFKAIPLAEYDPSNS